MTILTAREVAEICAGLTQGAAQVRFLQSLGLQVARKPDGSPLVNRTHFDHVTGLKQTTAHAIDPDGPKWGVH